jgi:hypothetical protein
MFGTPLDRVAATVAYALNAKATASMSKAQRKEWLRINSPALCHLPEDLLAAGVKHAVQSCEHVGQIVRVILEHTSDAYAARMAEQAPIAAGSRVEILRHELPRWNENLWKVRPDLRGYSEWRIDEGGQSYIHNLTRAERETVR